METIRLCNNQLDISNLNTNVIDSEGISELISINTKINDLTINISSNSLLIFNEFNNELLKSKKITFNLQDNSTMIYNLSNITKKTKDLKIFINFLGNNSKIETNIHSLVSGIDNIKISGSVSNNTLNNELLENVKVILIENGESTVIPDMLIDTNLVNANHKVAISNIRDNELFYLMTKGISKEKCEKLIKKSFLLSNISNDDIKQKISTCL